MKIQLVSLGIAIAWLTQAALAQQQPSGETTGTTGAPEHAFQASKVIGKKAKTAQGEEIGRVTDMVINPQTSETFAIVDLGRRRGMAPIPWQLISMGTAPDEKDITVNKSKDVLSSAPTVTDQQWANFNDPKFTQRIYAYYGVTPAAATGAPGPAPEGTEKGTGHEPSAKEPSTAPSDHPDEPAAPEQKPGEDKDKP